MGKGRLEAFSDGVLAIIITIMVLELRPPHETAIAALHPLLPVLFSYVLSFVFLGIYWNNHHHMLHCTHRVTGAILWANLHLLFWLSLVPFTTAWIGESRLATWPVALYGFVLLLAGAAYYVLVRALIALHGKKSALAIAVGRDFKGKISVTTYFAAVLIALIAPRLAFALYVVVAIIWLIPDRRIEKVLAR
jgi:uncharacterized membrane protein